jgi:hypothetical protein
MNFKLKSIFLIVLFASLLSCIREETPTQTQPPPPTTFAQDTITSTTVKTTTSSLITTTSTSTTTRTTAPVEKPAGPAQYQLTFEATWSKETHPQDFPSNPHFSPIIGASHTPMNLL